MTESERTPPRGNLTRALAKRMRAEQEASRSSRPSAAPATTAPSAKPSGAASLEDDTTVPRIVLPTAAAPQRAAPPKPAPPVARVPAPAPAPSVKAAPEIEQRWDDDTPASMWIASSEERETADPSRAEAAPASWSMPVQPAAAPATLAEARPAPARPAALAPAVPGPPRVVASVKPPAPRPTPAMPAVARPAPVVVPELPPAAPPPAQLTPAWPVVDLSPPGSPLDEPALQSASGRGWKIGLALGAASLVAFGALALWRGSPTAQHAAPKRVAMPPEPAPPSVAAEAEPPATAEDPSVQAPSELQPASAATEGVERSTPARTERSAREREGRDDDVAVPTEDGEEPAPSAEHRARDDQPSQQNKPSPPAVAASIATAPTTTEGVLRVTPAPAAAAPAAQPAPSAPPASAPPRAAPARGPSRDAIVLEQVIPKFPARARRQDVAEGTVALEYTVDKNGAVRDAVVLSASPPGIFEDAALGAIQRWRYQPKLQDGVPVATRKRFKFTFR